MSVIQQIVSDRAFWEGVIDKGIIGVLIAAVGWYAKVVAMKYQTELDDYKIGHSSADSIRKQLASDRIARSIELLGNCLQWVALVREIGDEMANEMAYADQERRREIFNWYDRAQWGLRKTKVEQSARDLRILRTKYAVWLDQSTSARIDELQQDTFDALYVLESLDVDAYRESMRVVQRRLTQHLRTWRRLLEKFFLKIKSQISNQVSHTHVPCRLCPPPE